MLNTKISPETGQKIKVLIVEDSAFMRRALRSILEKDTRIEVVGQANNGVQAIEEAKRLQPDVITLDIEMPLMDGLTALRHLRRGCQAAVLIISGVTTQNSQTTLAALRHGASDFVAKENSHLAQDVLKWEKEVCGKIHAIVKSKRMPSTKEFEVERESPSTDRIPVLSARDFDLILIGASTGGPPLLEKILAELPGNMGMPIVIAQHMPLIFTEVMSGRLNKLSQLEVHHAASGDALQRGHAYIAPGGLHTRIKRLGLGKFTLESSAEPQNALYKPSVNELFASGAAAAGGRVLGVVLTGMGEDGVVGGKALVDAGGKIIAQDRESSVVYGMPKAVTEKGLVIARLTPDKIVKALAQLTV